MPSAGSSVSVSASGGKEERNVVKIQEGGDGVEGRGSKDRRATEGEERVKRKVGRNTHSLSPLLFLFLGGSQIKARGKAKKKRRKNIGREGQQRTTRRFPPSNPPDDDRPRPSLPSVVQSPFVSLCLNTCCRSTQVL